MFRKHEVQEKLLPNLLGMIHFAEEECMFLHTLDAKRQGFSSGSYDEFVIRNFEPIRFMRQTAIANCLAVDLEERRRLTFLLI